MGARTPARRNVPTTRVSRAALGAKRSRRYVLKLYIAGVNRKSTEAIRTITGFCDDFLKGRYQLAIIDTYQLPALARAEQIIAVPTLIREHPLPLKRIIGSLADLDTLLVGLDRRPGS
jgi:circadian clock protein KaiB